MTRQEGTYSQVSEKDCCVDAALYKDLHERLYPANKFYKEQSEIQTGKCDCVLYAYAHTSAAQHTRLQTNRFYCERTQYLNKKSEAQHFIYIWHTNN